MATADVQWGSRIARQPKLSGYLIGAEPGEFQLTADVPPPVWITGWRLVMPSGLSAAGHLVQSRPPGPVVGS
ncbi:MAG TPA: hypothetical protein VN255_17490, partial [Mycobacterium sp.]|nr:hypothetical protein [Mycobacterium sp.]